MLCRLLRKNKNVQLTKNQTLTLLLNAGAFLCKQKALPFDSAELLAERVGFEPTVRCRTFDFESNTFDHSDTSPYFVKTLQLVCKRLYYYTI